MRHIFPFIILLIGVEAALLSGESHKENETRKQNIPMRVRKSPHRSADHSDSTLVSPEKENKSSPRKMIRRRTTDYTIAKGELRRPSRKKVMNSEEYRESPVNSPSKASVSRTRNGEKTEPTDLKPVMATRRLSFGASVSRTRSGEKIEPKDSKPVMATRRLSFSAREGKHKGDSPARLSRHRQEHDGEVTRQRTRTPLKREKGKQRATDSEGPEKNEIGSDVDDKPRNSDHHRKNDRNWLYYFMRGGVSSKDREGKRAHKSLRTTAEQYGPPERTTKELRRKDGKQEIRSRKSGIRKDGEAPKRELEGRYSEFDGPFSDYEGHRSDYEGPLSDYEGPLSDHGRHLSDYEGHLSDHEGPLSACEEQVSDHEGPLSACEEQVSGSRNQLPDEDEFVFGDRSESKRGKEAIQEEDGPKLRPSKKLGVVKERRQRFEPDNEALD
jgi:hypothetical protein